MDPLHQTLKNLQKMTEALGNIHSASKQPWNAIGSIQDVFDSGFWENMMKMTNYTEKMKQDESSEQQIENDTFETYEEEIDDTEFFYMPNTDLFQTKQKIIVCCEAPGLQKGSLEISLANNRLLTIKGRIKRHPYQSYLVKKERFYGDFTRKIKLPMLAATEGIKTLYSNGLIQIHLMKKLVNSGTRQNITLKFGQ